MEEAARLYFDGMITFIPRMPETPSTLYSYGRSLPARGNLTILHFCRFKIIGSRKLVVTTDRMSIIIAEYN